MNLFSYALFLPQSNSIKVKKNVMKANTLRPKDMVWLNLSTEVKGIVGPPVSQVGGSS